MDEHVAARLNDREHYSRAAADLLQQLAETEETAGVRFQDTVYSGNVSEPDLENSG